MITWTEGDLFASDAPALAHGVNCKGVMGAGIARLFRDRHPKMFESYRRRCLRGEMKPGEIMAWREPGCPVVFNLATQQDPGADAQPWMIAAAVGRMITEAYYDFGLTRVAMPLIGCGIGGLTPDRLQAAIQIYQHAPVDLVVVALLGAR